ncbi:uncharacterized protein C10orf67, mitochondrial isoform X2 [Lingula anatina]|uniref:Uncharacterized protein C10orf67, mitochondrial isoform X1 n=1 Tax=Lingula anatina TaxID=7574 RepID=A0A1S3K1T0_LINAN|nr:uncharacterized protein C10orf67, mitochondrial isoform X1 [Lingula anatina]XP_013416232.1 uncharacterized protein C10orf67, mitochondrial isoform X2 [Lingula anatina]|eukprot:XP_013416231.1 uncharacterized protein C10orf67, mitochondrial isoform X1 [Lingula anatina]
MAELDLIRELNIYSSEEDDLRNNVLALESYRVVGDESLRPSLAEQRKVGFFRLDRPTQTEVTEIVDLQEMTEVLQTLLQDVNILKREIHTARGLMLADFESKLQKKALELYCRINSRVDELEKMHADRVGVIRRAFRQQLSDALSNVASIFDKNYQNKMNSDQKKKNAKADKLEAKIRELQGVIQRNDMVIEMLKTQLAQYSKQAAEEEEESRPPTKSPSINPELDDLRENVFNLENKVSELEKALDTKTDLAANLSDEVDGITKKLEQEKRVTRQLQEELENLRENSEQEMAEARRMSLAEQQILELQRQIEQQRIEMEQEMNEKTKQARDEVLSMARSEAAAMADSEGKKVMKLMEEKKKLEEQLAKERALVAELSKKKAEPVVEKKEEKVITDVDKIILSEQKWRVMVAKMKKELEKTHKMWEKKFAILQHSLHALKDESFLRQTLQKQAATLHHAAVSYATDTPLAILPTRPPNSPTKKPLPEIPSRAKSPANGLIDDENQVMSDDDQGLPPGVVPLPTPPARNLTDCADDSRPSTRTHVVMIPSVEAQ